MVIGSVQNTYGHGDGVPGKERADRRRTVHQPLGAYESTNSELSDEVPKTVEVSRPLRNWGVSEEKPVLRAKWAEQAGSGVVRHGIGGAESEEFAEHKAVSASP